MVLNRSALTRQPTTLSDVEALRDEIFLLKNEHKDLMIGKVRTFRAFFDREDERNARTAKRYWDRMMDKSRAVGSDASGSASISGPLDIEIHDSETRVELASRAAIELFGEYHDRTYTGLSEITLYCSDSASDKAWGLVNGALQVLYEKEISIIDAAIINTIGAGSGRRVRAVADVECEETLRNLRVLRSLGRTLSEDGATSLLSSESPSKLVRKAQLTASLELAEARRIFRKA